MAWELSSWLVLTRSFQFMGALAASCLNGYLVALIYSQKLGMTNIMIILEFMAGITAIYVLLAILIQHTGRRSKVTSWLIFFVLCDIVVCGVILGAITLLSNAGLPSNCAGLTRYDILSNEEGKRPQPGYTTTRFSNEGPGQKGELDKFCAFERSYFFIAIGFVFTLIMTIVLSILRIYESSHTKNSRVSELLSALERANEMDQKLLRTPGAGSLHDLAPKLLDAGRMDLAMPHIAPSEGILTRNTSVRSTMTEATAVGNPYRSLSPQASRSIPRRPVLPPRPLSMNMAGPSTTAGLGLGLVSPMSGSDDESADAALVSDGMHHRQQRDQAQRMPMLPEEDQMVDIALVSDGMRSSEPMLPPYEPRRGGMMAGHGTESNEMRLSDYVKGETRAQTMKDRGGY